MFLLGNYKETYEDYVKVCQLMGKQIDKIKLRIEKWGIEPTDEKYRKVLEGSINQEVIVRSPEKYLNMNLEKASDRDILRMVIPSFFVSHLVQTKGITSDPIHKPTVEYFLKEYVSRDDLCIALLAKGFKHGSYKSSGYAGHVYDWNVSSALSNKLGNAMSNYDELDFHSLHSSEHYKIDRTSGKVYLTTEPLFLWCQGSDCRNDYNSYSYNPVRGRVYTLTELAQPKLKSKDSPRLTTKEFLNQYGVKSKVTVN